MNDAIQPSNPDYERAVREGFARQGLMGTIGAWLVEVRPGRVVIELPYSQRIAQQHGRFHGAVVGAIGDNAGGYAALTLMAAGSDVLTIEYKINFMRPARGLLLRAEGQVIGTGGPIIAARVDISVLGGEEEGLCAAVQSTVMRIEAAPRSRGDAIGRGAANGNTLADTTIAACQRLRGHRAQVHRRLRG